jgi:hypothetical protein
MVILLCSTHRKGEHVANYGDLALNLAPDWTRNKLHNQQASLRTVGHENGVADAHLTKEPDTEHQFAWVDTRNQDEISLNRAKGYDFIKKDGWTKNPDLWEWDAEGFCFFAGQRLMARSKERFLADMADRRRQRDAVMGAKSKDEEYIERMAAHAGIEITGSDDGKPLRRKGLRN